MSRKLWRIFWWALLIRVLFSSGILIQADGNFLTAFHGFDGYYEIAENLLAGNGFSQSSAPPFVIDDERTPLYPLFIAAFVYIFHSYYAILIAQIILGSALPLLAYRIALQITARERVATLVAVFSVLEPLSIHFATKLVSETFFTVLFLVGTTLFLDYIRIQHKRALIYATAFFALAILARPTIQLLPLLFIFVVFFLAKGNSGRAVRHSLIVTAVFFLILAPWSIRNFVRFGNPALSVQYASVPYGYLIPSALALEKNIGFMDALTQFYEGEGNIKSVGDITLSNAPFYRERAAEILRKHPVGLIKSIGVTFLTFFTHDGYFDILRRLDIAPSIQLERPAFTLLLESPQRAGDFVHPLLASPALFVILGRILWIFISLLFIIGAVQFLKTPGHRAKGIFILLIILYFALTTIAVGLSVNARFRFPVNALILTFAAYGIANMLPKRTAPPSLSPPEADPFFGGQGGGYEGWCNPPHLLIPPFLKGLPERRGIWKSLLPKTAVLPLEKGELKPFFCRCGELRGGGLT